jgi:hypothetical protein
VTPSLDYHAFNQNSQRSWTPLTSLFASKAANTSSLDLLPTLSLFLVHTLDLVKLAMSGMIVEMVSCTGA